MILYWKHCIRALFFDLFCGFFGYHVLISSPKNLLKINSKGVWKDLEFKIFLAPNHGVCQYLYKLVTTASSAVTKASQAKRKPCNIIYYSNENVSFIFDNVRVDILVELCWFDMFTDDTIVFDKITHCKSNQWLVHFSFT